MVSFDIIHASNSGELTPLHNIKPRWWHGWIKKLAASPFGLWLLPHTLHHIDKPILKLTGNSRSLTSILSGLPVILLTSIGAKSGVHRQTPLVAFEEDGKLILIASFFGSKHHPAWYYNLKANPHVEIRNGDHSYRYTARQAEGEQRAYYWNLAAAKYQGFSLYQQKANHREIPVMILEPVLQPSPMD